MFAETLSQARGNIGNNFRFPDQIGGGSADSPAAAPAADLDVDEGVDDLYG